MSMPNVLLQLARNNPRMQQIKQMMGMINGSSNPSAMLNQMIQSNPNYQQIMNAINSAGGDPQKAFYAMAEQKGVNPQDILDMLK